jgi:hypothetical protein
MCATQWPNAALPQTIARMTKYRTCIFFITGANCTYSYFTSAAQVPSHHLMLLLMVSNRLSCETRGRYRRDLIRGIGSRYPSTRGRRGLVSGGRWLVNKKPRLHARGRG